MVEVEPQYTYANPTYEWSADNTKVTAKRVCNEYSYYVQKETVNVTAAITQQPTTTAAGTISTTNITATTAKIIKVI